MPRARLADERHPASNLLDGNLATNCHTNQDDGNWMYSQGGVTDYTFVAPRACLDGSALTGLASIGTANGDLTVNGALHVTGGVYDGEAVGVMAAKTADQTNAAQYELITFDTVITNVGGGYDSATSTFTAPYDGLYHFSTVVLSDHSTTGGVSPLLYKNGVDTVIRGWSDGEEKEQAVLTAVLVLQRGDAMAIRAA